VAQIIVIDDEPGIRRILVHFLRSLKHEVLEAENGRQAMSILAGGLPDLVLTDIYMPDMDGIEIVTELRRSGGHVPVIVISGGGTLPKQTLLANAKLLGAVASIEKPFDLDELGQVVEAALTAPT
jgi:two-component system response regulator AtoC